MMMHIDLLVNNLRIEFVWLRFPILRYAETVSTRQLCQNFQDSALFPFVDKKYNPTKPNC